LYILRSTSNEENGIKTPRGFLLSAEDKESWAGLSTCFFSHPLNAPHDREMWFSKYHSHDIGAFGRANNSLVNLERAIQDERGTMVIEVDPSTYQGSESVTITVIE